MTAASLWLAIDANVYIAQFTRERFSPQAANVFSRGSILIAPDFIGIEVASGFLKKVRASDMSLSDATSSLHALPRRVRLVESSPLWAVAIDLAIDHGLTAYDALYVALALREQCQLVTADRQIADVLRSQSPGTLAWLGDFT